MANEVKFTRGEDFFTKHPQHPAFMEAAFTEAETRGEFSVPYEQQVELMREYELDAFEVRALAIVAGHRAEVASSDINERLGELVGANHE